MGIRLSLHVWVMSIALLAVTDVRAATNQVVSCPPSLNGGTIASVRVQGGTCDIRDTRVEGDIQITGGVVNIRDSHIGGAIRSQGGAVRLFGGVTVEGDLQITRATEGSGFLGDNNRINGTVRYWQNSEYFTAHYGTIGGGMSIENNTGGASIIGNSVGGGDLICRGNDPSPTGFDNKGNKVDQCSGRMRGKTAASTQVRDGQLRRQPVHGR